MRQGQSQNPLPALKLQVYNGLMRIFLTGGSGDLGSLLTADLIARGDTVANIDMLPPKVSGADFIHASIMDRNTLAKAMPGTDCVMHIAAWHGIHEGQKTKSPAEFHDLNVTGTFNVLEAAAVAGVKNFVFISSTSIRDRYGVYGHTKILNEEMCQAYTHRHGMRIIILRPRAFIPPWNRSVYSSYIDWAHWFMRGAVHIDDVEQAVLKAIARLADPAPLPAPAPAVDIDGAYEYTAEDLAAFTDKSFDKYYAAYRELAAKHGLETDKPPRRLDNAPAADLLGYAPTYSLMSLLQELERHGDAGPPAPFQ